MAKEVISYEAEVIDNINGHGMGRDSPLILIDIGASRSVCVADNGRNGGLELRN